VIQSARLAKLLSLLEERPIWSVAELAVRFDVSDETVRRDVRQLEKLGRAQKTHGGVSVPSNLIEAPYRVRLRESAEAKQRIGRRAAGFVSAGMTLLLDSGTTSFWMARALAGVRNLTIITNSMEIAAEVLGRPGYRLLLAGGVINSDYRAAFGAEPAAFCRRFVPDLTVLSMGAVDAVRGFLDYDADEAAFKRSLVERAQRVMVLADRTKFDKPGFIQVAEYGEVHDLVTDRAPPAATAAAAMAAGTSLYLAEAEE
jgi:DeoR family glycerol-3-phosphate regulon repressor